MEKRKINKKETYKQKLQSSRIDKETGEIFIQTIESEYVPGYIDVKLPNKGFLGNGDFITIFQNTMFRIATEANLSRGEYKLLLYLLGTAGFDNSICVDSQILVEDLKDKRPNIMKALKGLVDRKIIIRNDGYRGGNRNNTKLLPMELRVNYDQLNYNVSYKGKYNEHKKVKFNHPEINYIPPETPKLEKEIQLKLEFPETE